MIYVASSWKNELQPLVVETLREQGFEVYDFRDGDFKFENLQSKTDNLRVPDLWDLIKNPVAQNHWEEDKAALDVCDALVVVFPCGNSSHLEAGYVAGRKRPVIAYMTGLLRPDLTYNVFNAITSQVGAIPQVLRNQGVFS